MPRYFFSLVDGKHSAEDKYGKELDNLYEAHLHALRMFEKLIQFIPDSLIPSLNDQNLPGRRGPGGSKVEDAGFASDGFSSSGLGISCPPGGA